MVDAWPVGVPQKAKVGSFHETPDRNVSTFQPDRGPPLEHRATSVSSDTLSFETNMSPAQFDTLAAFYRDTLADGALPFMRKHPRFLSDADQTFKFLAAPEYVDVQAGIGRVALKLRRMP